MTTTTFNLHDHVRAQLIASFVGEADSSEWGDAYLIRGARCLSTCPSTFTVEGDGDIGDINEHECSVEEFVLVTADYQGVGLEQV